MAEGTSARVHFLHAIEPVGPSDELEVRASDDPLSVLDRHDAMMAGDEDVPLGEDDELGIAAHICEDAGVVCTFRRQHGMATRVLQEQCVAMDLLVLGRQGTIGRRAIGATASRIISQPVVPTLLCREEVVPLDRVLLVFESSPSGGRALRTAADLCSSLDLGLDVVVADANKLGRRNTIQAARRALRAYNVSGEDLLHKGRSSEAIRSAALEFQSSMVVVPDGHSRRWPPGRSEVVTAAVECPGTVAMVVP